MNLGLTGQIPQPNGWVLPPTVVDLSIGNTAGERSNAIRGPIPPGWKLPEGARGARGAAGAAGACRLPGAAPAGGRVPCPLCMPTVADTLPLQTP